MLGKFLSLYIVTNNLFFGEHSHKTVPCNSNSIFRGESLVSRSVSFTGHSHKIVPSLVSIDIKNNPFLGESLGSVETVAVSLDIITKQSRPRKATDYA